MVLLTTKMNCDYCIIYNNRAAFLSPNSVYIVYNLESGRLYFRYLVFVVCPPILMKSYLSVFIEWIIVLIGIRKSKQVKSIYKRILWKASWAKQFERKVFIKPYRLFKLGYGVIKLYFRLLLASFVSLWISPFLDFLILFGFPICSYVNLMAIIFIQL